MGDETLHARSDIIQLKPISVTFADAKRLTDLGTTSLYELVKLKRLRVTKVGKRSLINYADLENVVRFAEPDGPRDAA